MPGPSYLGRVTADLVVAESGFTVDAPSGWTVTRDKKYGRTRVTFLERAIEMAGETAGDTAGDTAAGEAVVRSDPS